MPYTGNGLDLQSTITRSAMLQSTHKMFRHLQLHHFAAPCAWRHCCLGFCVCMRLTVSLGFVSVIDRHIHVDFCFSYPLSNKNAFKEVGKKGIIRHHVAQEATYTNQQSSRLWHDVYLMNMMWYNYLCPSLRQYVDQEGYCSKPINLTPLRRANNGLKWEWNDFPFFISCYAKNCNPKVTAATHNMLHRLLCAEKASGRSFCSPYGPIVLVMPYNAPPSEHALSPAGRE